MIKKRMVAAPWLKEITEGCETVVELGAGFFDKLNCVNKEARILGIEASEKYIAEKKCHRARAICGDIREFEKLVPADYTDCVYLYDVIEHLTKEDGLDLIERLKAWFDKVCIKVPSGECIQVGDPYEYGEQEDELQTHKSTWTGVELEELGFDVIEDDVYHAGEGPGRTPVCAFAVWKKGQ